MSASNLLQPTAARALVAAALLASTGAWAVDYGTVISSMPVTAQVPVVQRQCSDETVRYQAPSNGAGAVIGAIAGAVVGSQFGGGAGHAVATGLGMVAGAAIGDQVQANANPPVAATQQRCRNLTQYENRLVGYDVVYEYQGVRRSARLAQDPGARIALDVNVVPAGAQPLPPPVAAPQPVYTDPSVNAGYDAPVAPRVVYASPGYYSPPVYLAPSVVVAPWPVYGYRGSVWVGGGAHRGHRF